MSKDPIGSKAVRPYLVVGAILAVSLTATVAAMRRTSTTFDEIVLIAGGARGFETGRFDLAPEHPPLMQYVYGLPVFLAGAKYPEEGGDYVRNDFVFAYRYDYAKEFMGGVGNDWEHIAFLARSMAALLALLLVLVTYAFARRTIGGGAAVVAAGLVAFLPDVLGHGGVAYNDVPIALFFVAALWAIDEAVRRPSTRLGVVAGVLVGLAFGTKFSAIVLAPAAVLLVGAEAAVRWRQRDWWRDMGRTLMISVAAVYLTLVVIYRGDVSLGEFGYGMRYTFFIANAGQAPAYLFGRMTNAGWVFFPLAFLLKTPVALHILMALGLLGMMKQRRPGWRQLLQSRLRAPTLGAGLVAGAVLTSHLTVGFRYALPALPLLCMLVAAGAGHLWRVSAVGMRATVAAVIAWYVFSSLSYYPHFLAYTSEYISRDQGYRAMSNSSLDWGQGLIGLREFMQDEDIETVYLSYFGSAAPESYGIDYVPWASFIPLPSLHPDKDDEMKISYAAISATHLHGIALHDDPFAGFRELEPYRVIGHSLLVFRVP
ncbi:MAG: glycosyltransferase family 39 protein [Gemmatimonadetes bacterium]|nr:glycosyltransferase family 39 protein [Gemmatimonadota bacterium]